MLCVALQQVRLAAVAAVCHRSALSMNLVVWVGDAVCCLATGAAGTLSWFIGMGLSSSSGKGDLPVNQASTVWLCGCVRCGRGDGLHGFATVPQQHAMRPWKASSVATGSCG